MTPKALSREIKFRAWDKKNNEWANLNQLSDWGSCELSAVIGMGNEQYPYQTFRAESDDKYELMQYTGLHDKNGKEIYEGDIVRYMSVDGVISKAVVYEPEIASFVIKFGNNNHYIGKFMKIIGNIYETPELLN